MHTTLDAIETEALKRMPEERVRLADDLLASVSGETERRIAGVEAGRRRSSRACGYAPKETIWLLERPRLNGVGRQWSNKSIDWTHNGGQRFRHSSAAVTPLSPNHR
jgi:hypothetical protein